MFYDYIWNQRAKYIQISTNMPSIGLVVREKDVIIWENNNICSVKVNGRVLSVNAMSGEVGT